MDSASFYILPLVVEQGSLNKAAKRLDVSQARALEAMDRLESGLGVKLLDRAKRNHGYRVWRAFVLARKTDQRGIGIRRKRGSKIVRQAPRPGHDARNSAKLGRQRRPSCSGSMARATPARPASSRGKSSGGASVWAAARRFRFRHRSNGVLQYSGWTETACHLPRPLTGCLPVLTPPVPGAEPTMADLAQFPWVCPMVGGRQRTVLEKLLASEGVDLPQQMIECGSIRLYEGTCCCQRSPGDAA